MRVLVLTNRADETANYLCSRMADAGVIHTRIDTESVASTCSVFATPQRMELGVDNAVLTAKEVRAVWYRRPKPVHHDAGGDHFDRAFAAAEWTAAFEGFLCQIPTPRWINHPSSIVGASAKLEQLMRAKEYGLSVPAWCCTTDPLRAIQFFRDHESRVVAKPLYCGYIERETPSADTVIYTTRVRVQDIPAHSSTLGAPTLFQHEVAGGVDVRVTIVDDEAVAVRLWRDDNDVDIRRNNMVGVKYAREVVPTRVTDALHSLVRSYGLRFAAVDMMVTGDHWQFLEVNPNGQWAWLDLVGAAEIYKLFLTAFRGAA